MKIKNILAILLFLTIPLFVSADRGMVVWPADIHLSQSVQNAIVGWNGEDEVIILSSDIKSSGAATVLEIFPLPANPTVEQGDFASFEKLVEIMNSKIGHLREGRYGQGDGNKAAAPGVEITFEKKIGAHDVTVVKVNDLDCFLNWIKDFTSTKELAMKEVSSELKAGIANYLKREINYFVFDVVNLETEEKESVKPLVYKFKSDCLYYPILISGVSEIGDSRARIKVFTITEEDISHNIPFSILRNFEYYSVELSSDELAEVSADVAVLFDSSTKARVFDYYGPLKEARTDLMIYPNSVWQRNLSIGSQGEDVKKLQKVLINEGFWQADVDATGYFGQITKQAVIRFQENYRRQILQPAGLEKGSGYFGSKSRGFLDQASLSLPQTKARWSQNLTIGTRSEEVKALQGRLMEEGLWPSGTDATGYFGQITKQAVIRFQEKYADEILKPAGLEKGSGFVGPSTRAYLKTAEKEYYGSAMGSCRENAGCIVSGCNSEICQSKDQDPMMSICVVPLQPTPQALGYKCQCSEGACQWLK